MNPTEPIDVGDPNYHVGDKTEATATEALKDFEAGDDPPIYEGPSEITPTELRYEADQEIKQAVHAAEQAKEQAMTSRADALTQIQALLPEMEAKDVEDLFSPDITQEDAENILLSYKDYGALKEPSRWDKVLAIAKTCAEIASIVMPIAGAISGIIGIAVNAKALSSANPSVAT